MRCTLQRAKNVAGWFGGKSLGSNPVAFKDLLSGP